MIWRRRWNPELSGNDSAMTVAPAQYLAKRKAKDTRYLKDALDMPLQVGFTFAAYTVPFYDIPLQE